MPSPHEPYQTGLKLVPEPEKPLLGEGATTSASSTSFIISSSWTQFMALEVGQCSGGKGDLNRQIWSDDSVKTEADL